MRSLRSPSFQDPSGRGVCHKHPVTSGPARPGTARRSVHGAAPAEGSPCGVPEGAGGGTGETKRRRRGSRGRSNGRYVQQTARDTRDFSCRWINGIWAFAPPPMSPKRAGKISREVELFYLESFSSSLKINTLGLAWGLHFLWPWGGRTEDPFRGLRAGAVRYSPFFVCFSSTCNLAVPAERQRI